MLEISAALPSEVCARLVMLKSMRLVAGRSDPDASCTARLHRHEREKVEGQMSDAVPFLSIPCPYCRQPCTCWTDHIGAAYQSMQTGPYVCRACGAMEGGWDEDYGGAVFDRATGWLRPGTVAPADRDFAAEINDARSTTA